MTIAQVESYMVERVGYQPQLEYFVDPSGDDDDDGSEANPWQTLARVNAAFFLPGATIKIAPGDYRESLIAPTSGVDGAPIVFEAIDPEDPPVLWGSDVVSTSGWSVSGIGSDCYQKSYATTVNWALADHVFLSRQTSTANVAANANSWYWASGILYVHLPANPASSGVVLTACVREDVIYNDEQSWVTFRNLVVKESAKYGGGYGVRAIGGTNVTLEDLDVSGCGTHCIGAISTQNFVGTRLNGYNLAPGQGLGSAGVFVSYASSGNFNNEWSDLEADTGDDSGYPALHVHGAGTHSVVVNGLTANGYGVSIADDRAGDSTVELYDLVVTNGTSAIDGVGVKLDRVTLSGPTAVLFVDGDGCIVQNVYADDTIVPDWHGARPAVIVDRGTGSVIQFVTCAIDAPSGACIARTSTNSGSTWRCNVLQNQSGAVLRSLASSINTLTSDRNAFGLHALFVLGTAQDTAHYESGWTGLGYEANSVFAEWLDFADMTETDHHPTSGSPFVGMTGFNPTTNGVAADLEGNARANSTTFTAGAFVDTNARAHSWLPIDIGANLKFWVEGWGNCGEELVDLSGNGGHVPQATASKRPVLSAASSNLNGERGLVFDGSNDSFDLDAFAIGNISAPYTLYLIWYHPQADGSNTHRLVSGGGKEHPSIHIRDDGTVRVTPTNMNTSAGVFSTNTRFIVRLLISGSGRAARLIRPSVADVTWTGSAQTTTMDGITIGALNDGSTNVVAANAEFAGALLIAGDFTASENTDLIPYLRTKYNIPP